MTSASHAADSAGVRIETLLRWLCVIAALAAVIPAIRLLRIIWESSEYLAHGYVIPAVSLWLAISNRSAIAAAFRTGSVPRWGPLVVLGAALIEMAAVSGEVVTAAGAGVPLLLGAAAYALGGLRLVRECALPLGFLVLMVPLPNLVELRLLIELKLIVTRTAVALLQLFGYTVANLGNRVLLPGHELFVADACSGFTSIVTMLPLSVVVAYFLSHGVWRRVAIVASVLPLAVIGNVARIFITVALVAHGWIEFREGLLHGNLGVATFTIGTIALVGIARALR